MERRAFGGSDVGMVRDHNEDTFLIDSLLGLYIVCDGLGGHAAGEVASAKAAQVTHRMIRDNYKVLETYIERPSFYNRARAVTVVELAIETASREVYWEGQADPEKRGMASTIALLQVVGNNAILAHVGDSRIFLLRQGQVHQLTEDHSLVNQKIKKGQLTQEEAARLGKCAMMTRAIGFNEFLEVDTLHLEMMPGDLFLLCSDGLSDLVLDLEIQELAQQAEIDALPEVLIELANSRGGRDNITAVVVQVDPDAVGKGQEVARKVEALRQIPLFQHLHYQELVKVLNVVRVRSFDVGEMIITEGDLGDELFILLSGLVQVSKGGHRLTELGKGSFFGEMALLDKGPRSADVIALEPARMMVLRRGDFNRLLKSEPNLAVKLLWAFCHVLNDRLRDTSEELSFAKANLSTGEDLIIALDEVEEIEPEDELPSSEDAAETSDSGDEHPANA